MTDRIKLVVTGSHPKPTNSISDLGSAEALADQPNASVGSTCSSGFSQTGGFKGPVAPDMADIALAAERCAASDDSLPYFEGDDVAVGRALTPAYELFLRIADDEPAQDFIRSQWDWPNRKRRPDRNKPALLAVTLRLRPMTVRHRDRCGDLADMLIWAKGHDIASSDLSSALNKATQAECRVFARAARRTKAARIPKPVYAKLRVVIKDGQGSLTLLDQLIDEDWAMSIRCGWSANSEPQSVDTALTTIRALLGMIESSQGDEACTGVPLSLRSLCSPGPNDARSVPRKR